VEKTKKDVEVQDMEVDLVLEAILKKQILITGIILGVI
jgi:hypothetical protein